MNWPWNRKKESTHDRLTHDEELRLLREATDEVKRAAEELAQTNEVLRLRLERMEASSV